ncbi:type IV toxin-antitoxin system AbiEi family antitoxin domain-containing protein [Maricaulis maris]|uniref:type IV toxin-antitoxin system AbiEi family antitoxin domain-containing protein n=1 Tax=Maricaulis maris TaxID=74318 RepID=UPI003A90FEEB
MSVRSATKINQLLSDVPAGVVMLSAWLKKRGYGPSLQQRYRENGWLEALGNRVLIRAGDEVDYLGALYALQTQLGSSIHPGGRTALNLTRNAHYLEFSTKRAVLFGADGEALPSWFKNHDWGTKIDFHASKFLPPELGLVELEHKAFTLKVSGPVRALMECLYLAPKGQDLVECYEVMEGLNNLRPAQVQKLLEACGSIKVKRLFLFMANKAGHDWFNYLKLDHVDLGSGKRRIVNDGVYNATYQITLPRALAIDAE